MKQFLTLSPRKANESGQALVESALVFIVVLLLLAGLVEFGWAFFHYLALQDAAGEGAAYGTLFSTWHYDPGDPRCVSDPAFCNEDPNNITYRVRNESQSEIIDWGSSDVDIQALFFTPGNYITVTAIYTHTLITPLLTTWVPDGTITLRATAVQRILAPPPAP
jgi:hypothetical protein